MRYGQKKRKTTPMETTIVTYTLLELRTGKTNKQRYFEETTFRCK